MSQNKDAFSPIGQETGGCIFLLKDNEIRAKWQKNRGRLFGDVLYIVTR
nr:hypothetical protein [uncultured Pedobacter sp.]